MYDKASLIRRKNQGKRIKYVFFWGHTHKKPDVSKACFSQWYPSPFECEGKRFHSAEHYMMYQKAVLFEDAEVAEKILKAGHPKQAKALGREVRGFDQAHWEAHRFDIVVQGNRAKFEQHPELKGFLCKTGDRVLVEASPVDAVWGIGLAEDDPKAENPIVWPGLNLLGFALMKVRDEFEV